MDLFLALFGAIDIPEEPKIDPRWIAVGGGVFAVVGLGMIWIGRRISRLAKASKTWPAAKGKILASSIGVSKGDSTEPTKSMTTYTPVVEYEYEVRGEKLRGTRIKFGGTPSSTNRDKAQALSAKYPVGGAVDVYYDPAKPTQCTLDQTVSGCGIAMLYFMGAIFFLLGAGALALYAITGPGN